MGRVTDWDERLVKYLNERQQTPFKWGINDCALFAADAVLTLTGVDLASEFRGLYNTRKSAEDVLRQITQMHDASLDQMLLRIVDEKLTHVDTRMARRGDVVLAGAKRTQFLCVNAGLYAVGVTRSGTIMVPRKQWSAAWSV